MSGGEARHTKGEEMRTLPTTNEIKTTSEVNKTFVIPVRAVTRDAREQLRNIATMIQENHGELGTVCQIDPVIDENGNISIRIVGQVFTKERFQKVNKAIKNSK